MPFPEGTILVQWQEVGFANIYKLTDTKAVIQVFKDGDEYLETRNHVRPNIGDIVLRFLNKNGKPGKKVEIWQKGETASYMSLFWLPVGVKHPKAA